MNKYDLYLSLPFFVFLLFCALINGCKQEPLAEISEKIRDPYQSEQDFSQANHLSIAQDYEQAALVYAALLANDSLSRADSIYLLNQWSYCRLIINQPAGVEKQLYSVTHLLDRTEAYPPALAADHFFNRGRYYLLQELRDSALVYAHRALARYYKFYPTGHLKTAYALNLLALIHQKDGNLTDSIQHYSLLANNLFLDHPEIRAYDWENDYVLGYASLLLRAHDRGEFYCRATLSKLAKLPFDNKWLEARAKNLLGHMLKKQSDLLFGGEPSQLRLRKEKLYQLADSCFQEAIAIAEENQDPDLLNFYVQWIYRTCRASDTTQFFRSMAAFKQAFSDSPLFLPHAERLLGYYYDGRDHEQCIEHYTAFLETIGEYAANTDYRIFADSYYGLRVAHRELGHFAQSARYAKRSFRLYNCLGEAVDINQPDAVHHLDSTNRYCLLMSGFFSEGLLQKYDAEKKAEDLALANAYYDFIHRHSLQILLNKDEDAFLTFQIEGGNKIYGDAMAAAYEAWRLSGQKQWLEKTFNYMEHLKSFLLYRDMIKDENNTDNEAYSLSDSIRVLQGQVNQVLFSLSRDRTTPRQDLYQKKLINTLSSLEQRRSIRLGAIESDIYQRQTSIRRIQAQLEPQQAVVNFHNSHNRLFSIYVDRDTVIFHQLRQGFSQYKQALMDFRNSIEQEVRLEETLIRRYLKSGHLLYEALIQPFAHRLSEIGQLVVIPDETLNPVPFEALLSEEVDPDTHAFKTLPYLLHQVEIIYTSSWKVYLQNRNRIRPDFRDSKIGFWTTPELNTVNGLGTIEESIQSSFGRHNYQIFNQAKRGKQLFSDQHKQFDVLHLLLHAGSSRINRYDNQIRFGEGEAERVYGFELYQEKFRSKLVVLASCESATGTPQSGEGTFSLARSFINSGVPEVVAAQFLIPQTTTGPLLSKFYHYLGTGHTASRALHLAKIDYLGNISNERHAYPRFWAGMVIFN